MATKQDVDKSFSPPHTTEEQFGIILQTLKDFSSWQESLETHMNGIDLRL